MRSIGDKLEDYLESRLKGVKKTTNSGAFWDNADLSSKDCIFEAKVKNKGGVSISPKILEKVKKQAARASRESIVIQQVPCGTYVVLELEFFIELWEMYANRKILKV